MAKTHNACAKKNYDRAIADYSAAIRLDPKYAEAFCERGKAYFANRNYGSVIADYNEAIRLDPKYVKAFLQRASFFTSKYNLRAHDYDAKETYDRAIADCNEAIRLDPKSAKAFLWRGSEYYLMGDTPRDHRLQHGDPARSEICCGLLQSRLQIS